MYSSITHRRTYLNVAMNVGFFVMMALPYLYVLATALFFIQDPADHEDGFKISAKISKFQEILFMRLL